MSVYLGQMAKKFIKYAEPTTAPNILSEPPAVMYEPVRPLDIFLKKVFALIGMIQPKAAGPGSYVLIPIIRQGLPKKQLDHLIASTGLSLSMMAHILHISERTLHRYSSDTTLNPDISERILEIAQLYAKGAETFGDLDRFKSWVHYPSMALGHKAPLDYLDTSIGIKLLEDELGRIEHGVFA